MSKYKIGDKVVRTRKNAKPLIWDVIGFSNVFANNLVCSHPEMLNYHFHENEIRLAEDDELKFGHRL